MYPKIKSSPGKIILKKFIYNRPQIIQNNYTASNLDSNIDYSKPNFTLLNTFSLLPTPPEKLNDIIDEIPSPSCQHNSRIHSKYYIEISHDYGETWKEPDSPPPRDCRICTVANTPNGKYQVCAGIFDSIYNSSDYGETWIKAKNQPNNRAHFLVANLIKGGLFQKGAAN
jgi:hypothetical protein